MKAIKLAAGLLLLAGSAWADVSDSGNLTIGGQGVIQGTMTVQGNAFSVGGSTFAVLGGTVNVGGLLKVSAAGIQWDDGKVSTTTSSGGGGNMTASGANNVTGSIAMVVGSTFTATQSTSLSGTRIVAGQVPIFSGVWHTVASTNITTAVSSTTFQMNFSSASRYELYWSGSLNAASNYVRLRFGSGGVVDTANNYSFSTGAGLLASMVNQYSDAASYCRISYENATDYVSSGQPFHVRVLFKPTEADTSKIIATIETTYRSAERSSQVIVNGGCRYTGSGPVNVVQLFTDNGASWKGTAELNVKDP
jgi:hypothetical protein